MRERSYNLSIDQRRQMARAETVVDVHHGHAGRATVEHGEQGGDAAEAGPVADGCGHGDHRRIGQPAHHRGQRTLHPRHHDDHIGLLDGRHMGKEPVQPGHAHIADFVGPVAHQVQGQGRLFQHRQIAGARTDQDDALFAGLLRLPVHPDTAGQFVPAQIGHPLCGCVEVGAAGSRPQQPGRACRQPFSDGRHLFRRLALAVDGLWEAAAQRPVVIQRGEVAHGFVGQAAQLRKRCIYRDRAVGNRLQ